MSNSTPIIQAWEENAQEWIRIIDEDAIASRSITNPAIVEAIKEKKPKTLLDLGCGEGWLCRTLQKAGIQSTGVDAVPALIERAQQQGGSTFQVASYEDFMNGQVKLPVFEALVFNFALFQDAETLPLLKSSRPFLQEGGLLFIQTLHPLTILRLGKPYQSQWIEDAWKGLPGNFSHSYSWFARTFAEWVSLFQESPFDLVEVQEPLLADDSGPASVIFVLQL
ncbi:MAG: methyltransferase domain-containing protein [Bacteroidota bacterium]